MNENVLKAALAISLVAVVALAAVILIDSGEDTSDSIDRNGGLNSIVFVDESYEPTGTWFKGSAAVYEENGELWVRFTGNYQIGAEDSLGVKIFSHDEFDFTDLQTTYQGKVEHKSDIRNDDDINGHTCTISVGEDLYGKTGGGFGTLTAVAKYHGPSDADEFTFTVVTGSQKSADGSSVIPGNETDYKISVFR